MNTGIIVFAAIGWILAFVFIIMYFSKDCSSSEDDDPAEEEEAPVEEEEAPVEEEEAPAEEEQTNEGETFIPRPLELKQNYASCN